MTRALAWLAIAAIAISGAACKKTTTKSAPPAIALDMVAVPAGSFAMGSKDGDDDERPVHDEQVAAFAIGRAEVTTAEYLKCEAAHACTATPKKAYCNEWIAANGAHPINCVTWPQATAFCAWAGARLPSEVEWEYAARGADGRRFPWGNEKPSAKRLCWDGVDSDLGVGKRRGTCAVGAHPAGASAFGAMDLAGNVWEWTSDPYTDGYGGSRDDALRVVRGGAWLGYDPRDERASLRFRVQIEAQNYGVGFRCVR